MKTLEILIKVLLVTLMLLSVIGMFYYSETLEQPLWVKYKVLCTGS